MNNRSLKNRPGLHFDSQKKRWVKDDSPASSSSHPATHSSGAASTSRRSTASALTPPARTPSARPSLTRLAAQSGYEAQRCANVPKGHVVVKRPVKFAQSPFAVMQLTAQGHLEHAHDGRWRDNVEDAIKDWKETQERRQSYLDWNKAYDSALSALWQGDRSPDVLRVLSDGKRLFSKTTAARLASEVGLSPKDVETGLRRLPTWDETRMGTRLFHPDDVLSWLAPHFPPSKKSPSPMKKSLAPGTSKTLGTAQAKTDRTKTDRLKTGSVGSCACGPRARLQDTSALTTDPVTGRKQKTPHTLCTKCGHMAPKAACDCGRAGLFKGRVHGFPGDYEMALCHDCGQLHVLKSLAAPLLFTEGGASGLLKALGSLAILAPRPSKSQQESAFAHFNALVLPSLDAPLNNLEKGIPSLSPLDEQGRLNFDSISNGRSLWVTPVGGAPVGGAPVGGAPVGGAPAGGSGSAVPDQKHILVTKRGGSWYAATPSVPALAKSALPLSEREQSALWKSAASLFPRPSRSDVIKTPTDEHGRVDYEAVPHGSSIWITCTKDGPMRGRHILVTKRPDGLFAVTGGVPEHAKGAFHTALDFSKPRQLSPEERERRERNRIKREEMEKKRKEALKTHGKTLRDLKEARQNVRGKIWESLGIEGDDEQVKRLTSYRKRAREMMMAAGLSKADSESIAGELMKREDARLAFAKKQALAAAVKASYEARMGQMRDLATPEPEPEPEPQPETPAEEYGSQDFSAPPGAENGEPFDGFASEVGADGFNPLTGEHLADLHGLSADHLEGGLGEDGHGLDQILSDAGVSPEALQEETPPKISEEQRQKIRDGIAAAAQRKRDEEAARLAAEEAARREAEAKKAGAKKDAGELLSFIGQHRHIEREIKKLRARPERATGTEDEAKGSLSTLSFAATGTHILSSEEAQRLALQGIEDQVHEETRGAFYQRLAGISKDKVTGEVNPDHPFGHLTTHYEAGAVKALNRISTEFLGTDALRGEIVKGMGVQAATEALLHRLKSTGVDLDEVRSWMEKQQPREMATVERALSRDEVLQKEQGDIEKQAREECGEGTRLSAAVRELYLADNLARQHENMGEALGSLEAMGTFNSALANLKAGVTRSGVIELNAGEDFDGVKERVMRTVSKGVANRLTRGQTREGVGVARIRVSDLGKTYLGSMGDVTENQKRLAAVSRQKENTDDFTVPGIKIGEGHEFASFRPGQQADVRHIMAQLDILDSEKDKPKKEKTIQVPGLFINREVGGGKSLISLAVGQHLLNTTAQDEAHKDRPLIVTCPEKLLANWHGQVKTWCEDGNDKAGGALVFGQHPGGKLSEEDAGEDGQAAQYLKNKDELQKLCKQILAGDIPGRRIIIGQKALSAKVKIAGKEMTVGEVLNMTNPLMVAHDEPQTMTTAAKGVLGTAGKAATKLGVNLKDRDGKALTCARLALTATPARNNATQLYDMAKWVTGGAIGTKKEFESKNGSLGLGTNVFEESVGDAVLAKLRTQMVSERGAKKHKPHLGQRLTGMADWQKAAQAKTSAEYAEPIRALKTALDAPAFRGGKFRVRMSAGWKDGHEIKTRAEAQNWLGRLLEKHDGEQMRHLYGIPPGTGTEKGAWKNNPALQEVARALDEREENNPGGQHIFWAHNEDTMRGLKQMLAEKYPDSSTTTMWKEGEMPKNSEEFKAGKHKFVIASHKANAGFNLQNADSAYFVGLPKEAVDNIQARGRLERDPRTGDPYTYHVDYHDAPTVHRYNHIRANEQRLVEATNMAVRGKVDLPIPADTTGVMARADAYTGQYNPSKPVVRHGNSIGSLIAA